MLPLTEVTIKPSLRQAMPSSNSNDHGYHEQCIYFQFILQPEISIDIQKSFEIFEDKLGSVSHLNAPCRS